LVIRTPRSSSKQHQQQHLKGQTNINKFFPLILDGSSRESDTPQLAFQQQRQQQQQQGQQQQRQQQQQQGQQQQGQQQQLMLMHQSPIEGLLDQHAITFPDTAAESNGIQLHGGGKSGSSSGQVPSAVLQQQLDAVQLKHQHELQQVKDEAR
jgi:hypothetical protein